MKRLFLLVFHPLYSIKQIYKRIMEFVLEKPWQFFYHPIRLFRLKRIDKLRVPAAPGEIRLFLVVRNEAARLPYLWEYYKNLGVDRFFVVDNDSSDSTISFLLAQKNTHVFHTKESYSNALYGSQWCNILLRRFGQRHWCVVCDADEFLIYPHYEELNLKELGSYLDSKGYNVVNGILLDMYAKVPLRSSRVKFGEDPLTVFNYFDRNPYTIYSNIADGHYATEGVRHRIFGLKTCLNKVTFLKYSKRLRFWPGFHFVLNEWAADIKGLALHYKFNSESIKRAYEEVKREQHWRDALEYKEYKKKYRENPDICFFYHGSVKFEGSGQLVELGIMKTSDSFEDFFLNLKERRKNKC